MTEYREKERERKRERGLPTVTLRQWISQGEYEMGNEHLPRCCHGSEVPRSHCEPICSEPIIFSHTGFKTM